MKKTLSALLVLAMMLTSVFVMIPAFAAEAEAKEIKNAEDFAAMEYDGNYILAEDITIEANWHNPDHTFVGTLDGNGKKITLADPAQAIFQEITGGTVKNLVIDGAIAVSKGDIAGLAKYASGTFENITSNVDISVIIEDGNYQWGKAGGIFGVINGNATVTNCKATGEIVIDTNGAQEYCYAGGIAGAIDAKDCVVVFNNCVSDATLSADQANSCLGGMTGWVNNTRFEANKCINNGDINTTQSAEMTNRNGSYTSAAGMVGATNQGGNNDGLYVLLSGCENNGDIIATETEGVIPSCLYLGGMLGRALHNERFRTSNCKNTGDILVPFTDTGWSGAGGMAGCFMTIGMSWAGKGTAGYTIMEGCYNSGKITGKHAGGMWGSVYQMYVKDQEIRLQYCVNDGDVIGTDHAGGMIGLFGDSNNNASNYTVLGCKNTGDVTAVKAAGIIARMPMLGSTHTPLIQSCINTGTITSTSADATPGAAIAAGILGVIPTQLHTYTNVFENSHNSYVVEGAVPKVTIKDCVSAGALVKVDAEDNVVEQDRVAITLSTTTLTEESTGNIFLTGIASGENSILGGEAKDKATCDKKIEDTKVTVVDVTALDGMVTTAKAERIKDDYDADAWKAYEDALKSAETFLSDYINKTEEEVADEVASLKAALDTLEVSLADSSAQKAALEAKIADAKDRDGSKYTGLSWGRVEDAVKAAEEVLKTGDRISVFEAATAAIQKELDALVEKPTQPSGGTTGGGDTTGGTTGGDATEPAGGDNATEPTTGGDKTTEPADKKGCGSAIAATAVVLSTVLALGACVTFKKKED